MRFAGNIDPTYQQLATMDIVKFFQGDLRGNIAAYDAFLSEERNGAHLYVFSNDESPLAKCFLCNKVHGLCSAGCSKVCSSSQSPVRQLYLSGFVYLPSFGEHPSITTYDKASRTFSGMPYTAAPVSNHCSECVRNSKPVVPWTPLKRERGSYTNKGKLASAKSTPAEKAVVKNHALPTVTVSLAAKPTETVRRPSFYSNLKLSSRKSYDDIDFLDSKFSVIGNKLLQKDKAIQLVKLVSTFIMFLLMMILLTSLVNNVDISKIISSDAICSTNQFVYSLHSEASNTCSK